MLDFFHGELKYPNGHVAHFRYWLPKGATRDEMIAEVHKNAKGSTVLWLDDGFTPKDQQGWDGWSMNPNFDPANLAVEKLPCV